MVSAIWGQHAARFAGDPDQLGDRRRGVRGSSAAAAGLAELVFTVYRIEADDPRIDSGVPVPARTSARAISGGSRPVDVVLALHRPAARGRPNWSCRSAGRGVGGGLAGPTCARRMRRRCAPSTPAWAAGVRPDRGEGAQGAAAGRGADAGADRVGAALGRHMGVPAAVGGRGW
ncbi:hypothetical protein ACU686_03115 [Yinghuangia aomiensis]